MIEMTDTSNLPKLLTPKDLKAYLHVGNTKVYEMIKRKDFPSFVLGGNFYIMEDKFIEWMETQTKKLRFNK